MTPNCPPLPNGFKAELFKLFLWILGRLRGWAGKGRRPRHADSDVRTIIGCSDATVWRIIRCMIYIIITYWIVNNSWVKLHRWSKYAMFFNIFHYNLRENWILHACNFFNIFHYNLRNIDKTVAKSKWNVHFDVINRCWSTWYHQYRRHLQNQQQNNIKP